MEPLATILPNAKCFIDKLKWIKKLRLTDPTLNVRPGIHLILCVEAFEDIIGNRIKKGTLSWPRKQSWGGYSAAR